MSTILSIPQDYGYVLLAAAGITLQCFLAGFSMGRIRRRVFPQDFMKDNFGDIHQQEMGREIGMMGFPDTGSGRYSEKLDYRTWFTFNCSQRSHVDFVEQLTTVIPLLLIAGAFYPIISAVAGFLYFTARISFLWNYRSDGPDAISFEPYVFSLSIITLAIITIIGGVEILK
jgi:uncharacterized membrane protein YphA (DoxX/SURF4 family)